MKKSRLPRSFPDGTTNVLRATAITLLLASCAATPPSKSYHCESGARFEVHGGDDSVTLTLPDGRPHTLPRVRSGSGVKYTDRHLLYWDQGGGRAVLAGSNHGMTHCRVDSQR